MRTVPWPQPSSTTWLATSFTAATSSEMRWPVSPCSAAWCATNLRSPASSRPKSILAASGGGSGSGAESQPRAYTPGSTYSGEAWIRRPLTHPGWVLRASVRMSSFTVRASYGQIIQMLVQASTSLRPDSIRRHSVTSRSGRPAQIGSARMRTCPSAPEAACRFQYRPKAVTRCAGRRPKYADSA
jgi:hypothetical protein